MFNTTKAWNVTPEETRRQYPCDQLAGKFDEAYFRGVTVHSSPGALFLWLCQLKAAPYSYDWLDNFNRKSPDQLTPGLDKLETGQAVMLMFTLESFEKDRHLTIRSNPDFPGARVFGDVAVSYVIEEQAPGRCRLLVKLAIRHPGGFLGALTRALLPLGDLIMMKKQLRTLKRYAERTERRKK